MAGLLRLAAPLYSSSPDRLDLVSPLPLILLSLHPDCLSSLSVESCWGSSSFQMGLSLRLQGPLALTLWSNGGHLPGFAVESAVLWLVTPVHVRCSWVHGVGQSLVRFSSPSIMNSCIDLPVLVTHQGPPRGLSGLGRGLRPDIHPCFGDPSESSPGPQWIESRAAT